VYKNTEYSETFLGEYDIENTMKMQVLKYGELYIGRYEAGNNTTIFKANSVFS